MQKGDLVRIRTGVGLKKVARDHGLLWVVTDTDPPAEKVKIRSLSDQHEGWTYVRHVEGGSDVKVE